MNANTWTADAVEKAVIQGNPNLEIVLGNYFKAFIVRLGEYDIGLQGVLWSLSKFNCNNP